MEFKLFVVVEGDSTLAFKEASDQVREMCGAALTEYVFTMKTPFNSGLDMEYERLMWVTDAFGTRKEMSLEKPAFCLAYLSKWTLPQELTMKGWKEVHPVISNFIYAEAYSRVFPSIMGSSFFQQWAARQETGSAEESQKALSVTENSTPA